MGPPGGGGGGGTIAKLLTTLLCVCTLYFHFNSMYNQATYVCNPHIILKAQHVCMHTILYSPPPKQKFSNPACPPCKWGHAHHICMKSYWKVLESWSGQTWPTGPACMHNMVHAWQTGSSYSSHFRSMYNVWVYPPPQKLLIMRWGGLCKSWMVNNWNVY